MYIWSSMLMNGSQNIIYWLIYIPKRQSHYGFMSCFATLVQRLSRGQTFGPLVTHRWVARLIYGLRNAYTYIMVSRDFDVAIMTRKMYITLSLVIVLQNTKVKCSYKLATKRFCLIKYNLWDTVTVNCRRFRKAANIRAYVTKM